MTINILSPAAQMDAEFVAATSAAMRTLESIAAGIAPTNIPVLLVGEIGTGKRVFARRLHQLSGRSEQQFRTIACASLNSSIFHSVLGLAAKAEARGPSTGSGTGTLFFDEISELDATCQRCLLYALPDGETALHMSLLSDRLISATTRNLEEDVRAGRFRIELYYRINGVCLRLPPLRERKEDIPLLVEFFLRKHSMQLGKPQPALCSRTMQKFLDHSWPGNIRELENFVKKIVALGDEQLAVLDLGTVVTETRAKRTAQSREHSLKAAAKAASREAERDLILVALARTRWNRKRAAEGLQISYKSFLYKLKQIGLEESKSND
jgi:two-component system response regulator AtoC